MEKHSEVFVAFDVAKKKHAIAIAEGGRTGEVRFLGDVENSPLPIERTIKGLADRYDRLHGCFEAGPTGYGLYRQIQDLGHDCMVVAPALIPKRPGTPFVRLCSVLTHNSRVLSSTALIASAALGPSSG
jgi:transposase